jgi:hypothetical protein
MDRRITVPLAALALAAVGGVTVAADMTGGPSPPRRAPRPPPLPTTAAPAPDPTAPGVSPAALAYVDAVNAEDLDALVASFAADAVITDVSRQIAGQDAIRSWADREVIGGSLQVLDVVEDRPDGQLLLVHWAPGGSGGWRAHYDFTFSGGRLTAADLQYA